MIEMTPQLKVLIEGLPVAMLGQSIKEKVRAEPDAYAMSVLMVMNEFVHTRRSHYTLSMILEAASYPDRLKAAREFLEQERTTAAST